MSVLYKYCDQLGAVKILELLELKVPYISQVNDPLECLPLFYCSNDKAAMEARCLSAFKNKKIALPAGWKQNLNEQFEKGEIQKCLVESQRNLQKEWNKRKSCLLSVSKTAKEPVMWAHYAETHKGAVIGIDFDNIFHGGMKIDPVEYSKERPKINILEGPEVSVALEAFKKALMTKSYSWVYEEEFRTIFLVDALGDLQKQGFACLKDFNGKKTWFLRLNPESIREVVFGLYTEDGLKSAIRKLIKQPELQHVKLYQAEESETYTLNLVEIKN